MPARFGPEPTAVQRARVLKMWAGTYGGLFILALAFVE